MDLKMRRNDRGMSVFWMILICGAAVFLLLAVLLVASGGEEHAGDEAAGENPPLITAGDSDPMPGSASFDDGQAADIAPIEEGELPQGGPIDPEVTATPAGEEQPPAAADEEVEVGGEGIAVEIDPEAAEGEGNVVVDEAVTRDPPRATEPEPSRPAFETTPSGPEGRDDETILQDEIDVGGEGEVGPEIEVTE
jgi:hypothetical protein